VARHVLKEPRQMSTPRRVLALLASTFVLSAVGRAPAQSAAATITLGANPVTHSLARTGYRKNTQINFADCDQDDVLTFSTVLTNRASYVLEAWAGTACDQLANRTTANTTLCWKLFSALPSSTANPNAPTIPIHVRDLLAGKTVYGAQTGSTTDGSSGSSGTGGTDAGGTGGTAGTGGTDAAGTGGSAGTTTTTSGRTLPVGTLVTGTGPEACIDNSGVAVVTPITIFFMLVDGNSAIQGTPVQWAGNYKLLAPNPPDTVTATVGDGLLPVHFKYANNQSNDTTINGYKLYCDPPRSAMIGGDGGLVPVATDAGPVTPNCTSGALIEGTLADPAYECGSASLSATAANATGLTNGISYNVGVAAIDTYENIGKLSTLTCQVPQPVDGFFKAYRAAGGEGGGGFCSFSRKGGPAPLIALLGLASCLVLRRRRAS